MQQNNNQQTSSSIYNIPSNSNQTNYLNLYPPTYQAVPVGPNGN